MPSYTKVLRLRAEPELTEALNAVARRERTSVSELVRRELRSVVAARNYDAGPPPHRPASGQRIAA